LNPLRDSRYLTLIDGAERLIAKLLGLVLLVVMVIASVQLVGWVIWAIANPQTDWVEDKLIRVLGDLLNILIAVEVLQNITSYLRRNVVQIELVLITAMTAVARKVIVLPPGSEAKPQLLAGLGVAVLALAAAYWLVCRINRPEALSRTAPARRFLDRDR
jgi:uncharacterized membrane protein (DUF373 family)